MNEALPRTGVVVPDLDWSAADLDQRMTGRGGVEFSGTLVLRGEPVGSFECRGDGYPVHVTIRDEGHRSEWGRWVEALAAIDQPGPELIGIAEEAAVEVLLAETEAGQTDR